MSPASRLPETKTLYDILPNGTEGGKEFARVVDLLLFHASRRSGRKISIFSDSAGDYLGLDSFAGDAFRREGTTGYQYKFYPSPLSDGHRSEIKKALSRAAQNQKKLRLTKWILVTPQDLTESATRRDGGDVSWFEQLPVELDLTFELEHWGHRKLQALFIETPPICLHYFPELLPQGGLARKSLQETRVRYEENFRELHRRIEFVGMSVYKPEATQGVPMEHIYIPLAAVPDTGRGGDLGGSRTNPLEFLAPGARQVVLGDPGSGKSTLLRFLSLAGVSKAIQQRYGAHADARLPVLVTLRRYADELKTGRNLALLDYIRDCVQADFSLKGADTDFFEYYLESGQALLLFDGLDELPNSEFKQLVRDRIRALLTTYPGNTTIVTSRIVGYDPPFRFDAEEFQHYRLCPLELPEMEQFVNDWYRARIENPKERKDNADDLIRILRDDAHGAIRDLGRTPLLLTIIALVHRIDAVLPDERVVLYQKCTETLLNTWHTWKYRGSDSQKRGKVERRNRHRMEAIAHWMHTQARGTSQGQRAIVRGADLHRFLAQHIENNERLRDEDDEPEDLARDFLDFIRRRAGLLIEVGDAQYSFVHLTFQEYLTAAYVATQSERGGVDAIWEFIGAHLTDPVWHEVIRLLIATLKADETQRLLLQRLFADSRSESDPGCARLLGGLLLDAIECADEQSVHIFTLLFRSAAGAATTEELQAIVRTLSACTRRGEGQRADLEQTFQSLWNGADGDALRTRLTLILISMGWPRGSILRLTNGFVARGTFRLFAQMDACPLASTDVPPGWETLLSAMQEASLTSATLNAVAATLPAIALGFGVETASHAAFVGLLTVFPVFGSHSGPFTDLPVNSARIAASGNPNGRALVTDFLRARDRHRPKRSSARASVAGLRRLLELPAIGPNPEDTLSPLRKRASVRARVHRRPNSSLERVTNLREDAGMHLELASPGDFWRKLQADAYFQDTCTHLLRTCLDLEPRVHWDLALRAALLPSLQEKMPLLSEAFWEQTKAALKGPAPHVAHLYAAAYLLLIDAWLQITSDRETAPAPVLFEQLAQLTGDSSFPAIRVAHCLREIALGDDSRNADLSQMLWSESPEYRELFKLCLWLPAD